VLLESQDRAGLRGAARSAQWGATLSSRNGADRATGAAAGISGKNGGLANLRPYKPGESGNYAGRPIGDGLMRKRLMKSFLANEKQAMAAMARRWASARYVQDMWSSSPSSRAR